MNAKERKELGERFKKTLSEFGVKNVKDIPVTENNITNLTKKEYKEVWVIKG